MINDSDKIAKLLSVIVPAYNVQAYLEKCVDSFINCRDLLKDIEIVIVNDGSTDNTSKLAENYVIQYPETIVLVNKENGGHGSAINAGLEVATGLYVKVVDGDDWIASEGVRELIHFVKSSKGYPDIIVNPFERVNEAINNTELIDFTEFAIEKKYSISEINQKKRFLEMHAVTFRTDIFRENDIQIDERMFYVDVEYILFPIPYVETVVFLKNTLYEYRLGNVSQSVSVSNMIKNRDMHRNVIMSLLTYYKNNINKFNDEHGHYYLYRLSVMLAAQVNIYCTMKDENIAKRELMTFVKTYDLYKKENGISRKLDWKASKKIPILKITNYVSFSMISRYYRKVNGI